MSQYTASNSLAHQDTFSSAAITALNQRSMFWQPNFRQDSSWLEHTPFLFWLIEALKPHRCVGLGVDHVSHLAVCQAISTLHLDAHAYLIGEASPDNKKAQEAKARALDNYPATSHWLETTPTKAIQQFEEASIDLLLLNVAPEDDSVDYLLDRWLSRLSPTAIVLIPGVAKREPGCHVFRAFEAFKAKHHHFTFHHGAGLGALAVGQALPSKVMGFLNAAESSTSSSIIQDVFARLGRSCKDTLEVYKLQQRLLDNDAQRDTLLEQVTRVEADKQAVSDQQQRVHQQFSDLRERFERQEDRFAHERSRLAERVSTLEELNHELKEEIARQRNLAEHVAQEVSKDRHALVSQLSENERSLANAIEALSKIREESKTQFEELSSIKVLLNESEEALSKQLEESRQTEERLERELKASKQLEEKLEEEQQTSKRFEQQVHTLSADL